MRTLARIIAVLTVLNFLGSTVLAAMPLVWCVGADGHRAVESALFKHHAATPADAAVAQGAPTSDADHAPCNDVALTAPSNTAQAHADDGIRKWAAIVELPKLKAFLADAPAAAWSAAHPQDLGEPSARLICLRTVQLRL